jgi:hypothetical protein
MDCVVRKDATVVTTPGEASTQEVQCIVVVTCAPVYARVQFPIARSIANVFAGFFLKLAGARAPDVRFNIPNTMRPAAIAVGFITFGGDAPCVG